MLILRAAGLLLLVAVALCVGAWLLTGRGEYLRWTKLLLRVGVSVALVFMALLLFERLLAPIL
ncbi:hypothetical protein ACDA63_03320 [Uliginosibacterium sp. sgz301328]|uniref:hypothetical protein n=1 Tax=Uliginosibacterium sp. sgz301328 TaxID=3243764 RepID=UPI00359D7D13